MGRIGSEKIGIEKVWAEKRRESKAESRDGIVTGSRAMVSQ